MVALLDRLADWAPSAPDPRARLVATPLAEMGGAAVVEVLDGASLASLRAEADAHGLAAAGPNLVAEPPPDDAPNGSPDRWLDSAPGGAVLDAFYRAPAIVELLAGITGLRWETTGERGTYSYYRRPGHHLGLHRDIDTCELAFITCLRDDRSSADTGGILYLYPSRAGEPLSAIRRTPQAGAVPVRLAVGQTIALLGGLVPHRLSAVGPGQTRIIAPLCYRIAW